MDGLSVSGGKEVFWLRERCAKAEGKANRVGAERAGEPCWGKRVGWGRGEAW